MSTISDITFLPSEYVRSQKQRPVRRLYKPHRPVSQDGPCRPDNHVIGFRVDLLIRKRPYPQIKDVLIEKITWRERSPIRASIIKQNIAAP
jgi:hypothetical protein